MEPVLVEVEALARTQPEPALGAVRGSMVLEAHARLHRREHADEPLIDGMLREQPPSQVLLARGTRLEVVHRPLLAASLVESGRLDAFARREDERLVVEETNAGLLEEHEHSAIAHQRQERAPKDDAVEAVQGGRDKGAEMR